MLLFLTLWSLWYLLIYDLLSHSKLVFLYKLVIAIYILFLRGLHKFYQLQVPQNLDCPLPVLLQNINSNWLAFVKSQREYYLFYCYSWVDWVRSTFTQIIIELAFECSTYLSNSKVWTIVSLYSVMANMHEYLIVFCCFGFPFFSRWHFLCFMYSLALSALSYIFI